MMKHIRRLLFGLSFLAAAVFLSAPLQAATPPANPPAGGSFAQRLTQRKAERGIKLDEKDEKRFAQRCVVVQGKIRTIYQSATTSINDRNNSYQQVDAKLWVIIGQLKLAGQDTFQLEKQRGTFVKQINDFQTTGANFTQTLDDLQVINCEADVVGFKALLDTARLYYAQVIDKSNAINNYVVNDIKATLGEHVSALQPKSEAN